jgi:tetratricopeptide (TPR) repeat protein
MKDYAKAIALNPRQWQAYFNRAAELRDSGKLCDAVDDLNEVVKLNPEFVGAYMNRGNIYAREGELDKAIADYSAALQRDSNLSDVYVSRAELFVRKKKYQQAVSDLQRAVQMKTKRPEAALNLLAWLRATCPEPGMRDGKEAVQLALKACELTDWKDWGIIDTLAGAYAETGDFDQATNYQQCVLQMVNPTTDQRKLQQRLALYREHKPYREAANED